MKPIALAARLLNGPGEMQFTRRPHLRPASHPKTRVSLSKAALAELMQRVFSTDALPKDRAQAGRDLRFALKTTWAHVPADQTHLEESGVFPLVTLNKTKRGYLVSIGKQANGCYKAGWYDGCAVMMRRLLETSIIEAFEAKKIETRIKDTQGDFFQLTGLVNAALAETSYSFPERPQEVG
jgi:hypothetical protein